MNIKEYVESNGYKVEDLTECELARAREELAVIESGGYVIDGVFSEINPTRGLK